MVDPRAVIGNIQEALQQRLFPTITVWNRLESRPRTADFSRALTAEIRDPLWMLTRQWQIGELDGEDAGSPVVAKLRTHTTQLTAYQPAGGAVRPLGDDVPLEALVEQRPLPMVAAGGLMSLDLRLLMGRHWLKLVARHVGDFAEAYKERYPIVAPAAGDRGAGAIAAHLEAAQRFAAAAGRLMDGYAFYTHVTDGGDAVDGIAVPGPQQATVRDLAARFLGWFDDLIQQPPDGGDAWQPPRLEYGFSATAPSGPTQRGYVAPDYRSGRLDWYSFDAAAAVPSGAGIDREQHNTASFLPSALRFPGMPESRWWAFEDGRTNLAQLAPTSTELGKLLFLEFGLVYANDWFLVPHVVPAGRIADIEGLVVTDVFGERTWIDAIAAGRGPQAWAMFRLTAAMTDGAADDTGLLILPTAAKVQQGAPIEDVAFIRDEVANLVWAVETAVPLPSGPASPGREAARDTVAFHEAWVAARESVATDDVTPQAPVSYRAMSGVDENWIPFVPVQVPGGTRAVQLQRAALPRLIEGDPDPPVRIRPRTGLLREGLDASRARPYYVHEEEVPRSGVRVYRAYRRARWHGGQAVVWLGTGRQIGRGSGASGLTFDYLADTPR